MVVVAGDHIQKSDWQLLKPQASLTKLGLNFKFQILYNYTIDLFNKLNIVN